MLHHLQKLLLLPVRPSLRRAPLSNAAVGASPARFAAEDFLVATCGLTKEQAAKAARYIAHRKSPANANAVISFLASPALGLSKSDIAHLVSHDARILNCRIDSSLRPRVHAFSSHGFTAAQIRTFIRRAPRVFRSFNVDEKLGFWVPFLGSPEKFLRIARHNYYLVTSDLDGLVKINIQLLREGGLSDADIAKTCACKTRLLNSKTDTVRAILTRAEQIGIPRSSPMFRHAVVMASCNSPETIAAKLKFLGEMLRCSDAQVAKAVRIYPSLLGCSKEKLHRACEFLTNVVGIDRKHILGWPTILTCSLEGRIAPRHYVMKVLQEQGLMPKQQSFFQLVKATDEMFRSRFSAASYYYQFRWLSLQSACGQLFKTFLL